MPRDQRHALAVAEAQAGTEGQRECARGIWCASRTVTVVNGERVTEAALGPRAFCDHDSALIANCLRDLPGIFLRLEHELAQPAVTETSVHVPFGPSIPVRLDVDAAMRMTAFLLAAWAARVTATARLVTRAPHAPVLSPQSVKQAAAACGYRDAGVLLALQPSHMTQNVSIPPGRLGHPALRGAVGTCRKCGRKISQGPVSREWWGADGITGHAACEHQPRPETVTLPASSPVPEDVAEAFADAEIVRAGADFLGLFVQRDGAAAGLEILHLHYWDRAVLRETPARPEELLGVECRSKDCSALALRRAEPAWHSGDPDYYSECAVCGDLQTEEEYDHWVGQLHAYYKAKEAAMPTLAPPPAMAGGTAGYGGKA